MDSRPASEVKLVHLMYASQADNAVGFADLKRILVGAKHNNGSNGVTGLLCYCGGRFLQILEGDRKAVTSTFNRVALDRRHSQIELMEVRDIGARAFGEWTMKYVSLDEEMPEDRREILAKYSPEGDFPALLMSAGACFDFLVELRASCEIE